MNTYSELAYHLKQAKSASGRISDDIARESIERRLDNLCSFLDYLRENGTTVYSQVETVGGL